MKYLESDACKVVSLAFRVGEIWHGFHAIGQRVEGHGCSV